jgi:outer membrane protein OmpA-like peptidoglycan-associated protein
MVAVKNQEEARLEQEHQAVETSRLEAQAAKAETEAARATARAEAEASRAAAEAAKAAAQQATRKAREQVSREVSAEKLALRRKLREQLDRLLETRETERGLVVSMSDLLFPSGKAILQAPTREKLAKITGILMAYPGLHVAVEGHTDSTGPESFNQKLSERRAHAVRAFKIRQGLHPDAVTACGFGSTRPVASNEIPSGRQLNRRVDLILTGDPIGF